MAKEMPGGEWQSYERLSSSARLAAALHAFSAWLHHVRLNDPGIDECVDHLWSWLSISQDTFSSWEESVPEMERVGQGDELPPRVAAQCRAKGIDVDELGQLLEAVTEMVHHSLYSVIDDDLVLECLATVEEIVVRNGLGIPPANLFKDSRWSEDTWPHLTPDERDQWRVLRWKHSPPIRPSHSRRHDNSRRRPHH